MDWVGMLNSTMSSAGLVLKIGFFLGLLGLLAFFVIQRMQFKHTIIVRVLTGTKKLTRPDKFQTYLDDNGIKFIKLKDLKKTWVMPPEDAIDIDSKGRMFVEAYYNESEDAYCYLDENSQAINFKEDSIKNNFNLLPTRQKSVLVSQIRKAEKRNRSSFFEKNASLIVGGFTIVVILVIMMSMWDSVMAPSIQFANSMTATADKLNEVAMKLDGITSNRPSTIKQDTIDVVVHNTTIR